MENKIKKIILTFENCEIVELKPNMFKNLIISEISEDKIVNGFQYRDGELLTEKTCKSFSILINKKGLLQTSNYNPIILKERLLWNDITHIKLIYNKCKEEEISVPWNYKDFFENSYQKCEDVGEFMKVIIEVKDNEKR